LEDIGDHETQERIDGYQAGGDYHQVDRAGHSGQVGKSLNLEALLFAKKGKRREANATRIVIAMVVILSMRNVAALIGRILKNATDAIRLATLHGFVLTRALRRRRQRKRQRQQIRR
jgi:hypothetical protein